MGTETCGVTLQPIAVTFSSSNRSYPPPSPPLTNSITFHNHITVSNPSNPLCPVHAPCSPTSPYTAYALAPILRRVHSASTSPLAFAPPATALLDAAASHYPPHLQPQVTSAPPPPPRPSRIII
jgi:hypothetical protein